MMSVCGGGTDTSGCGNKTVDACLGTGKDNSG